MADVHILTHEFRPKRGGAGVVCERIAETLSRLGKEVTVWVPGYVADADDFEPDYDVRILRRLKGTRNLPCLFVTAREVAASRKTLRTADVYLGEPGPIAVFMFLTLFFPKFWKRLVITLHGSEILRYRRSWWWSAPLFKRLARKADAVHVLSTHNEAVLLEWLPELKSKLIRGFGMYLPGQKPPELDKASRSLSNEVKLLCVARIHPRKGQLELLRAISNLSVDVQKLLTVVFVGQFVKDRYYKDLLTQAQHTAAKVEFTGGLSDETLESTYQMADIFALTSVPYGTSVEGLGLVYMEAAQYALPILAHRIGGVSDFVIHGKNGYLSEPDDTGTLSQHLDILIRNPLVRRRLGEEGRAAGAGLKWETVVRQLFPSV